MEALNPQLNYQGMLFLIGFMGCGKTRLGKNLAKVTNRPFVDLDELIEEKAGKSISQIFEDLGETGFRELEMKTLQNSFFAHNTIVSTGGGAPCFYNNMAWINTHGISFFIDTPVAILASRLTNAKTPRPLIIGKTQAHLLQYINDKLKQRLPFYNQAHLKLTLADVSPKIVIDMLNCYFTNQNK